MEYVVSLVIGIELIQEPESRLRDPDGELMRHVDDSIEALEHRWTNDCGVELDVTRSEATYFVVVDTGDETRAISQAKGLLSIAIHAAAGATPHRPFPRNADWSVRLVGARATPAANRERPASPGVRFLDSQHQCEPHVLSLDHEHDLAPHHARR